VTRWKVASERIGKVGEDYDVEAAAAAGVNVDALIEGGFLVKAAPRKAKPPTIDEEQTEE